MERAVEPAAGRSEGSRELLASRAMSPKERRAAIALEVQQRGHATVAELGRRFALSEVTIRHDLDCLARAGLVRRSRGGAEAVSRARQVASFDMRQLQNLEEKRAIAKAAVELIKSGDIIFLDAGTTVLEVARALPPKLLDGGLTVVTRSAVIAYELRRWPRTRLVVLGGVYVHDFDDFVGEQVEMALRGMRVNTLFIGTDGLSLERGVTTDNVLESSLYRLMARCADQVVVVSDSSKIGRDQFQSILALDEIQALITDDNAPPEFIEALRARGLRVVVVPVRAQGGPVVPIPANAAE